MPAYGRRWPVGRPLPVFWENKLVSTLLLVRPLTITASVGPSRAKTLPRPPRIPHPPSSAHDDETASTKATMTPWVGIVIHRGPREMSLYRCLYKPDGAARGRFIWLLLQAALFSSSFTFIPFYPHPYFHSFLTSGHLHCVKLGILYCTFISTPNTSSLIHHKL